MNNTTHADLAVALRQITERLARIERRLGALEARVSRVEAKKGVEEGRS